MARTWWISHQNEVLPWLLDRFPVLRAVSHLCAAVKRLDVITGKGLHSVDNIARILMAVIEYVDNEGMSYYQKPARDGVMIHLADTGQSSGSGTGNGYAVMNDYG